jgi:pimeloyl-ACP methyl ester carboxylesterase
MTTRRRSLLHIAFDGPETGIPWLVLHGRYGNLDTARRLGAEQLPADTLRIAVRSARTQTMGSLLPPKGNFWFIGKPDWPELSTFGDALHQLSLLLYDLRDVDGVSSLNLLGEGEGGTMALVLALSHPDRINHVTAIGSAFPGNFDRMPLHIGDIARLSVSLPDGDVAVQAALRRAVPNLSLRGA